VRTEDPEDVWTLELNYRKVAIRNKKQMKIRGLPKAQLEC